MKKVIFVIIILMIGVCIGQPHIEYSIKYSGTGTVYSNMDNVYEIEGVVTHVVDGDTLDVEVSYGDDRVATGDLIRIRLADIDCPETRGSKACEAGKRATEFTRSWLLNNEIWLDLDDKTGKDQYGRWVAVVYYRGGNFNKRIVDAGHATVEDFKNNEFDPKEW